MVPAGCRGRGEGEGGAWGRMCRVGTRNGGRKRGKSNGKWGNRQWIVDGCGVLRERNCPLSGGCRVAQRRRRARSLGNSRGIAIRRMSRICGSRSVPPTPPAPCGAFCNPVLSVPPPPFHFLPARKYPTLPAAEELRAPPPLIHAHCAAIPRQNSTNPVHSPRPLFTECCDCKQQPALHPCTKSVANSTKKQRAPVHRTKSSAEL